MTPAELKENSIEAAIERFVSHTSAKPLFVDIRVEVPLERGKRDTKNIVCLSLLSGNAEKHGVECFAFDERRHEHYACRLGAATYPALGNVYPSTEEPEPGMILCPIIQALAGMEVAK